jgi:hypothetical protein
MVKNLLMSFRRRFGVSIPLFLVAFFAVFDARKAIIHGPRKGPWVTRPGPRRGMLEHLTKRLNRLWIHMTARIDFNVPTGTKGPVMNGKALFRRFAQRVVAAIEAGHTRVEVAELYNMALSTVGGFIKRKRETGSVRPDKFGGYKTFALEDHTALVALVIENDGNF